MDIFCLHDFWAKACLSGAEDLWQYAVPLDIFFDYVVAPYPLHLYSHAKCAMDTGADRGTWLEGRSSSSVQFISSTSFLYHFLTSRRFGFRIGVHLESGRVVWRSVYHIIIWPQFTYSVRLMTSGGSDLNHIGSDFRNVCFIFLFFKTLEID